MSNTTLNAPARSTFSSSVTRLAAKNGILLAFFILCVVLSLANEFFLTWNNWMNIIRQTAINGILAIGVTYVILGRGIDLSVGSIAALSGAVAASFALSSADGSILLPLLAGAATGIVLGAINGMLVSLAKLPAFIVTLGMLSVARGLTYIFTDGRPISNLSDSFLAIGSGTFFGISVPIILFAVIFAVFAIVLSQTIFGRHLYAVGGSEKAAQTAGLPVKRVIIATYVISGFLSAIAGIILTARTTAALPQAAVAYELDAIAAAVIGGTSLSGGKGALLGTLVGALIIGTINNGLDLMGVSAYYQQVVKGMIIVVAVLLDRSRKP